MHKRLIAGLTAFGFMMILILDGKTALSGARDGLELCIRSIIPALFPFFLLSGILTKSLLGVSMPILRPAARIMQVPEGAESLLICSFLGGYPVGANAVAEAYHSGAMSKTEAERMLYFSNNAGPSFLFGIIASFFPDSFLPWKLWLIHLITAVTIAVLIPGKKCRVQLQMCKSCSLSDILLQTIKTMSIVCGWVILFRIVIAFLVIWFLWMLPEPAQVLITGMLELTNGCCSLGRIESLPLRFILCSGMLSFGGVCVFMQTLSCLKGLSPKSLILGKLLHTLFSLILSVFTEFTVWSIVIWTFAVSILYFNKIKQKKGSISEVAAV